MKYKFKGTSAMTVEGKTVRKKGDVIDIKSKSYKHPLFDKMVSEDKSEKKDKTK